MAKKKYPPIIPVEDDPENKHLSKKEFVAKRKKYNERALKVSVLKDELGEGEKEERNLRKQKREEKEAKARERRNKNK